MLLSAFEVLKRDFSLPHRLILIGNEGGRRKRFAGELAVCGARDEIITVNYASPERLVGYYNCADLFVFPSLYEGFGLPILEAMACGTPVLALNVSSIPEVAGDAAVLLPSSSDAEKFAAEIFSLVSDQQKRQVLVEKGLQRVKSFGWERAAKQTLNVYAQLAR